MANIVPEIERRRAYRALDEKKIPEEVISRVMTAATLAPSCFNNQPWRFISVSSEDVLSKVKENLADANYWAKKSPWIVAVATRPEDDCQLSSGREYALFSTGLATENLMLQAVSEGLIAHPMAGFKPEGMKKVLGIPDDYILITVVAIGYPGDVSLLNDKHKKSEGAERQRKPIDEVVFNDGWTS